MPDASWGRGATHSGRRGVPIRSVHHAGRIFEYCFPLPLPTSRPGGVGHNAWVDTAPSSTGLDTATGGSAGCRSRLGSLPCACLTEWQHRRDEADDPQPDPHRPCDRAHHQDQMGGATARAFHPGHWTPNGSLAVAAVWANSGHRASDGSRTSRQEPCRDTPEGASVVQGISRSRPRCGRGAAAAGQPHAAQDATTLAAASRPTVAALKRRRAR